MDIIIRIFFIGLIAFVPNEDGSEMTVVVERARDGHQTSDGHRVEPHLPLLFTRAPCSGDCRPNPARIASFVYELPGRRNPRASLRQLDHALAGGGAWILDDVELVFEIPRQKGTDSHSLTFGPSGSTSLAYVGPVSGPLPKTAEEARAFGWIAHMGRIAPESAQIEPDVLGADPTLGLVAARMKIDRGSLQTYTLAEYEGRTAQLGFQPIPATSPARPPQAYAHWVSLDIPIDASTCSSGFNIRAQPLGVGDGRVMSLKPSCEPGSVTEIAIVNLPAWEEARQSDIQVPSTTGPHFELYYKLSATPIEDAKRAIPVLVPPNPLTPGGKQPLLSARSPLLQDLHLFKAKGVYSHSICIPVLFDPPDDHQ